MNLPLYEAMAILGILGVALAILQARFLRVLRSQFPEVWKQLGKPVLLRNTMTTSVSLVRYIWTGRFRDLGNERVSFLGRWVFIFWIVYSAALLVIGTVVLGSLVR